MKKVLLAIGVTILVLAGCKKETVVDDSQERITCTPSIVMVHPSGDEVVVMVQSQKAWSATTDKPWIKMEPTSGLGDAYVTITSKVGDEDSAHIAFTNGSNTRIVTIFRSDTTSFAKDIVGTKWYGGDYVTNVTILSQDQLIVSLTTSLFSTVDTCSYKLSYESDKQYPSIVFIGNQNRTTDVDESYIFCYNGEGELQEDEFGHKMLIVNSHMALYYPRIIYTDDLGIFTDSLGLEQPDICK